MLKRQFLADKKSCKVTFTTDPGVTDGAKKVSVVGDFNAWDATANPMRPLKNGTFSAVLKLPCGQRHQFRYLIDRTRWANDAVADSYVPTPFGNGDNSVIDLQEVS